MTPLVSVIIRTYNRATYVKAAVESVFAQSLNDVELIVVDDGSTDDTATVLEGFGNRLRPIVRGHCGNLAQLCNVGLQAARGEYIAFLDSDDLWLPEKLAKQVEMLASDDRVGFAYCNARLLGADGRLTAPVLPTGRSFRGSVLKALVRNMDMVPSTTIVRKSLVDRVGPLDESQPVCEEYGWFLKLARAADGAYVAEPLAIVRRHPVQVTETLGLTAYQVASSVLESLLDERDLPVAVRLEAHRSIARFQTHIARTLVGQRRTGEARGASLRALRRYPLHRPAWRWAVRSLIG